MTSKAFRIPSDLAAMDLTLRQASLILENRRKRATLQTRLEGLPQKKIALETAIAALVDEEKQMLDPTVVRVD